MRRGQIVFFVTLFFLLGMPAYAYGDPTGGSFLQIVLPALAAFWAFFLIFANRIRKAVTGFVHKLSGSKPDAVASTDTHNDTVA